MERECGVNEKNDMRESAMMPGSHPWLVPEWPQIAGVQAVHHPRGRVSQHRLAGPGDHVRDDPAAVAANRHILTEAIQRSSPGRARCSCSRCMARVRHCMPIPPTEQQQTPA
jgi:hypothetical protein